MKRLAPILYGLVTSVVLWSVFCCERGIDTPWVSLGDIGALDWLGLSLTFLVVWGFVGTATSIGIGAPPGRRASSGERDSWAGRQRPTGGQVPWVREAATRR